MLKIEHLENGNISLSIPDSNDRDELRDNMESRPECIVWADLLEPFSCNGGPTPIDPEVWFIGLTSDPYILGESAIINDTGDGLQVDGKIWYCPEYMIKSVPESLAQGESAILVMLSDESRVLERV